MFNPFYDSLKCKLDAIHSDAFNQLPAIQMWTRSESDEILKVLLLTGCDSQHIGNITLARQMFLEIPPNFLRVNLSKVIDSVLDINDEWQYRRLMELLRIAVPTLMERYFIAGQMSSGSDIRETADEFAWLVKAGKRLRFLFQVSGYLSCDVGVGLCPGIPQALIRNCEVGEIRQGSKLLIDRPDDHKFPVTMSTYTIQVPSDCNQIANTRKLPLIPIVSKDVSNDIPIGSAIYFDIGPSPPSLENLSEQDSTQ